MIVLPDKSVFIDKLKEAVGAVLPIVLLVAFLSCFWIPLQTDLMLAYLIGALFLIIGMALFTVGSEISMSQIGTHIGGALTRSRNPVLILVVSFLLGVAITVSEPDLQVLAANVPAINTLVLIIVVSVGVGLFLMLSMARILYSYSLRWLLVGFYLLIFLLALLADQNYISVSFDAGGVTTGPMTVPFIMALGIGVAATRSDARAQQDSFGLIGLCSVGPVLAVLILSFIYQRGATDSNTVTQPAVSYQDTVALGHGYLEAIPDTLREVSMAMLPIAIFFLIFQVVTLRLRRRPFFRIFMGLVLTLAGLLLFLTGVNVGFSPLGYMLGYQMADSQWRFLLIPVSAIMGWLIINAEPAVHVLNKQVEELSGGAISAKAMGFSLSIGVGAAMGLSAVRALSGISIFWFIVPGYALALVLAFLVPSNFTAIAFDSGGVASGPLTAAFMLPFVMGTVVALDGNVMTDAFGLVALVAMMPLITVQIMGVISVLVSRRAARRARLEAVPEANDVIELWEV